MVPEAPLEETDVGFMPERDDWFVLNARDPYRDGWLPG
jgi:hypothetical protein